MGCPHMWAQARACLHSFVGDSGVNVDAHASTRYAADGGAGMRWGVWCQQHDAAELVAFRADGAECVGESWPMGYAEL